MYDDGELDCLVEIIGRARPGVGVDRVHLETELYNLFQPVGLPVDKGEAARIWRELARMEPKASHRQLATAFRIIAKAEDPLAPDICSSDALASLNGIIIDRWAERDRKIRRQGRPDLLVGTRGRELDDEERADVREAARRLAQGHHAYVRRSRPIKDDQNILLPGIADIYLACAQMDCARGELPHARNSHFIQFAHKALYPFYSKTEVSPMALSWRWKRLKNDLDKTSWAAPPTN